MPSPSKCLLSLRSPQITLYAPLFLYSFQIPPHISPFSFNHPVTFSQQYWSCVSTLCNLLQSTVSHFLSTTNIFLSTLFSDNLSLCSSLNFVWNISNSRKSWVRYNHKRTEVFTYNTGYSGQILIWILLADFENYSNIKFHENPCSAAQLFHADGQTDGHDEANSRSPEFCNAPKNPCSIPEEDQVSRLYMDRYSAAWSAVLKLTAFSWRQ
jgi:hypothetical protein